MKQCTKNLFLSVILISGLGFILAGNVRAQTFTTLYSFTAIPGPLYTNIDGAQPEAGLILSSNTLYGTANQGGSSGKGTVFAINTDGTGLANLHNFTAFGDLNSNTDGATPYAGLILSGNTLYGTAASGGSSGAGVVFKINVDGSGFTNLHSFTELSP